MKRPNLLLIGPGIAIAATGVGAGDMIAASVAGAKYGTIILWAAVFGAAIKFVMNEGIARWQLATGLTLIEGWSQKLHPIIPIIFGFYLLLWSFIVAGALISACGLAGRALFGGLSETAWGMIHSIAALVLVLTGRYTLFEKTMKVLIAPMFLLIILCAILIRPEWNILIPSLVVPTVPAGSGAFILGVIGGVGGSVTLLSYGYWIREKEWTEAEAHKMVKLDLGVAYGLTGLFGVAMMIIASGVGIEAIKGTRMILALADQLGTVLGPVGKSLFLIGFWCAVFTSMIGVWQGIPYLFTDFIQTVRPGTKPGNGEAVQTNSLLYRGYLAYLAFPPMILLLINKPIWIIVVYSVMGSLFMPFLTGTLLFMNNKKQWVNQLRNGWLTNGILFLSLVVFSYLAYNSIVALLSQ